MPFRRSVTCLQTKNFQRLAIRFCGDLVHWRSRIVNVLGFSSCQSVLTSGVSIHMAAISLTTRCLALDLGINLLTSIMRSEQAQQRRFERKHDKERMQRRPTETHMIALLCTKASFFDPVLHVVHSVPMSAFAGLMVPRRAHPATHDARDLQSRPLQALATETTCLGTTGCLPRPSQRLGASTGE